MSDKRKGRLSSPRGQKMLEEFSRTVECEGMHPLFEKGITVALSGGADSVLLLLLLTEYRRRTSAFPMTALHVHHGIRAEEADRDAAFCRKLCEAYDVPFSVEYCDVPAYARTHGLGLEAAARDMRYAALRAHLKTSGASYIVTAHHATDQLETVLFHMLRGSGARGACGMWPVTEDILRPMLSFAKKDIVDCLADEKIVYMQDSTNDSDAYMRNYIRLNILPHLSHITPSPERAVTRFSRAMREDARCLDRLAESFFEHSEETTGVKRLRTLDKAIFARVLFRMVQAHTHMHPEAVHVDRIYDRLFEDGAFSVCLPGGVVFDSDGQNARVRPLNEERELPFAASDAIYMLYEGMNDFPSYGFSLYISQTKETDISLNVYKISIQANLGSAIIKGALRIRFRREGDAYKYGGMTHRVKRLFCDRHIPRRARGLLPLLCDEEGILWIPGFGVRQDRDTQSRASGPYITFLANDTFPMN